MIVEALESKELLFPRCTRSPDSVHDIGPTVVGLSDNGTYVYAARAYLRHKLPGKQEK